MISRGENNIVSYTELIYLREENRKFKAEIEELKKMGLEAIREKTKKHCENVDLEEKN